MTVKTTYPLTLCLLFLLVTSGSTPRLQSAPALPRVPNVSLRMPPAPPEPGVAFPQTLAETGAFADLTQLQPEPGIIPFEINVPLWADGAHKARWFSLPDTNLTVGFSRGGFWTFPAGSIWIKH